MSYIHSYHHESEEFCQEPAHHKHLPLPEAHNYTKVNNAF